MYVCVPADTTVALPPSNTTVALPPSNTTVALPPSNLDATSLPQLSTASGYCAHVFVQLLYQLLQ